MDVEVMVQAENCDIPAVLTIFPHLHVNSLFELEDGWAGHELVVASIEDFELHRDFAVVGDVSDAARSVVHHRLQLSARVFALQTPLSLIPHH